jgi:radical SAM superfamily enzyme YgiQ (UPF0313 family)
MKIIIIEPYDLNERYDIRSLTPNPGPIVVASLLKQNGHDAEVISEYVTKLDIEDLNKADFVGISVATYNAAKGFNIASRIKKPVVFGGFHASLMPEECLNYGGYVIRSDGYPVVDLARFLTNGRDNDIQQIPNLVYKQNGRIVYNRTESKAVSIAPDYGLVRDYYKFNLKRLVRIPLLVNASRGCPQDCTFCSIKAVYPDFKKKDVATVLADIQSQINHQHLLTAVLPKIIWITDDNFASDRRWAKDLLTELARLKHNYCFTVQARVDVAQDDELLELMQKARVNRVYLGIESIDQASLDSFNKKSSLPDIESALKKLRGHKIDVHGLFVFGDDQFQKGDGLRVVEFVKRHGLSGALIQPLTPYPGTRFFRHLEMQNRILHRNWEHYNGKVVFQPKNMTPAELLAEIYSSYSQIFSPWRVLRFFFTGNRGWKLEFLGEAVFRYLEKLKMKKYLEEKLVHYRA